MAKPLLPDELWEVIEPMLPAQVPSPKGGRPPLPHRQAKTGIGWEDLPQEMGCGCGMTCWRRLRDWQTDGTWQRIHAELLRRLDEAGKIDWDRAAIDSSSVRAVFGGSIPAQTPPIAANPAANIM